MNVTTTPFKDFSRLSEKIWYLNPQSLPASELRGDAVETSTRPPDLIILSTWMGAAGRHVSKYLSGYRARFSSSPILLIRNNAPDVIFKPKRTLIKQLQPALTVVESICQTGSSRILLHIFSNGGAHQARILAGMYRQKYHAPLPIHGMLLDSCPGIENWRSALAAFTVRMPKFFLLRHILLAFVSIFLLGHYIANHFLKLEPFLRRLRRELNDSTLFPKAAPRVYMYSKTDLMVGWKDVEAHAADAEAKGWTVRTDMFEGSKHVGHIMIDEKRYWDDVKCVA